MNFDAVVEMFKCNGALVDDMCTVTRHGRVIDIWIRDDYIDRKKLSEKVGSFL